MAVQFDVRIEGLQALQGRIEELAETVDTVHDQTPTFEDLFDPAFMLAYTRYGTIVERDSAAQAHEVGTLRAGELLEALLKSAAEVARGLIAPDHLDACLLLGGVERIHRRHQTRLGLRRQFRFEQLATAHHPSAERVTDRWLQRGPAGGSGGDVRQSAQRRRDTVAVALFPLVGRHNATMNHDATWKLAAGEIGQRDLQRNLCHVSRTVAKRVLSLVAQRFLALVQAENPLDESRGVADALNQRVQRRRSSLASSLIVERGEVRLLPLPDDVLALARLPAAMGQNGTTNRTPVT